jgi:hypothetical protein
MLIVVPTCRTKSGKPQTSDTVTAKGQESTLQIVTDTNRSKDLFTDGRFLVLSSDISPKQRHCDSDLCAAQLTVF